MSRIGADIAAESWLRIPSLFEIRPFILGTYHTLKGSLPKFQDNEQQNKLLVL